MIIFPYPKSTKCYGDTAIRRSVSNGRSLAENFSSILPLLSLELKKNVVSLQSDN